MFFEIEDTKLLDETLRFLADNDINESSLSSNYSNVDDFFRDLKIDSYDPVIFSHYATSGYTGGVCIVDESSMLPSKSIYKDKKLQTIGLDIIKKVYDTVVLVGDDYQLPPINGKSSFEGIESYHLTENHRAEKDLLRLLDYARKGKSVELFVPEKGENIRIYRQFPEKHYKESLKHNIVHIVYKNVTRREITRKIRGGDSFPKEDEPIVYYGKNINDPGDTIAKNEIGRFVDGMGEWDNHNEYIDFSLFDEYPSDKSYSKYRYGYVLTAHSAQGSSFDHVVVHTGDIPSFIDVATQVKWVYTACSRARKSVTIVR